MAYKNDGYLVIANRYGSASSDAKSMLYETYDRLRDLTVSGSGSSGTGFEAAGGFLYQLASLFAPSAFMTTMGGTTAMNIPGTSYWSKYTGGTGGLTGTYSSFGVNSLGNYSGFPSGHAAPLSGYATGGAAGLSTMFGYGSSPSGTPTGFASGIGSIADIASTAAYGIGTANGYGIGASNILMPLAGVVSGWGGIMTAAAPYLGEFGLPAVVMGNLMQGTTSAALSAYQRVSANVLANADTILSQKVTNIETVCKMLDTQSDIVRKMLKDDIESKSKEIDNI
ncbi:MAG: hypothetical protein MJ231_02730 [bacterium]|nr:hypothetical protein [bacterium]